jgi:IS1 family transposase
MQISFKEFLELDEATQVDLGSPYVASYKNLTENMQKQKKDQLESLLNNYDFFYSLKEDPKVWKAGHEMQKKIKVLVDFIGQDGHHLFNQYARIAGLFDKVKKDCSIVHQCDEDLSGSQKKIKMKELGRLLKDFDVLYHYSDDSRSYKRGKEQEETIEKLANEIGADGLKMYRKFLRRNENKESLFPEMDSVQRKSIGLSEDVKIPGQPFSNVDLYDRADKYYQPSETMKKRTRRGY